MSKKFKQLNMVDLFSLKKDLLWGKSYYALFEDNKLSSSILYSNLYESNKLIEIHQLEDMNIDLMKNFTSEFAAKKKIEYFYRELCESNEVREIEFMNQAGFRRFNRNNYYSFTDNHLSDKQNLSFRVFCREADKSDVKRIIELDKFSRLVEFREVLFRQKKYLREHIEDIYVFPCTNNFREVQAFVIKREDYNSSPCFEFVLSEFSADLLMDCVKAFAERYISFEKANDAFVFVVTQTVADKNSELQSCLKEPDISGISLESSSQLLILEGRPKNKIPQASANLAFSQVMSN